MMVGLLGTVFGLSIMVQHIGTALPNDPFDVAQVEKWRGEFSSVLSAMRTAFSSTLAGLTWAIALGLLNQRLAHAQAAFLDKLDRFTTEDLLPATVPGSQEESVLESVSLQMESNFKRLDDVAQNNQDILKELNAIEKGFLQIIDAIRQTTRSETSDRVQSLVAKFSAALDEMAKVNRSVVNVSEAMPRLLERVEESNVASISRIDRLIEAYEHQRSLIQWPLQVKVVFGFLVALNLVLIGREVFR
jgi:methyl-accepting chemotaxis protein